MVCLNSLNVKKLYLPLVIIQQMQDTLEFVRFFLFSQEHRHCSFALVWFFKFELYTNRIIILSACLMQPFVCRDSNSLVRSHVLYFTQCWLNFYPKPQT